APGRRRDDCVVGMEVRLPGGRVALDPEVDPSVGDVRPAQRDEPGSGGRGRVEEADRVVLAGIRIVAPVRHPAELASPVAQRTALARCYADRASIRGAQLDYDRVVPGIPDL